MEVAAVVVVTTPNLVNLVAIAADLLEVPLLPEAHPEETATWTEEDHPLWTVEVTYDRTKTKLALKIY